MQVSVKQYTALLKFRKEVEERRVFLNLRKYVQMFADNYHDVKYDEIRKTPISQ